MWDHFENIQCNMKFYWEFKILKFISFPMILRRCIRSHPPPEFVIYLKQPGIPNMLHFLWVCLKALLKGPTLKVTEKLKRLKKRPIISFPQLFLKLCITVRSRASVSRCTVVMASVSSRSVQVLTSSSGRLKFTLVERLRGPRTRGNLAHEDVDPRGTSHNGNVIGFSVINSR